MLSDSEKYREGKKWISNFISTSKSFLIKNLEGTFCIMDGQVNKRCKLFNIYKYINL